MAITSIGYDGPIDEVGFARMIPSVGLSDYGVLGEGSWKVTAHPSTAQAVNVSSGQGWGYGVFDTSDSIETVNCPAIGSGVRWDLIVAYRNWQPEGGTTKFTYRTVGTLPDIPSTRKNSPGVEDEQPIALVQWTAGQTQPAKIIDLRLWAGNGGLFAKEDLVRQYLTRVGSEVSINGESWKLRLIDNDMKVWDKTGESGKLPLLGFAGALDGTPGSGQGFIIQAGSTVQRTDGSGYARIVWPKPFPNGLLTVVATDGDDWTGGGSLQFHSSGRGDVWGSEGIGNRTSWVYAATAQPASVNGSGSLVMGRIGALNKLHRINWIAIGW